MRRRCSRGEAGGRNTRSKRPAWSARRELRPESDRQAARRSLLWRFRPGASALPLHPRRQAQGRHRARANEEAWVDDYRLSLFAATGQMADCARPAGCRTCSVSGRERWRSRLGPLERLLLSDRIGAGAVHWRPSLCVLLLWCVGGSVLLSAPSAAAQFGPYGTEGDTTAPTVSFRGTLWDARDTTVAPGAYGLSLDVSDTLTGISFTEFKMDGRLIQNKEAHVSARAARARCPSSLGTSTQQVSLALTRLRSESVTSRVT